MFDVNSLRVDMGNPRLISIPCGCGAATLKKFAAVSRRLEAVVQICGKDEIYPAIFDELIFGIPSVIDYQLTLGKKSDSDILRLMVEVVEANENVRQAIRNSILSHPVIRKHLEDNRLALPEIELVKQGTLTRLSRAKKLIIDER